MSAMIARKAAKAKKTNKVRDKADLVFRELSFLALLAWLAFFANPTSGAISLEQTNAVRLMGMGGAGVGLMDDLSSMLWNPAGLARLNRGAAMASSASLADQISQHFIGGALPTLEWGAAGVYGFGTWYGTFQRADASGQLTGTFSRVDYLGGLSYAKALGQEAKGDQPGSPFLLGVTVKGRYVDVAPIATAGGLSLDVGLLWEMWPGMSLGLAGYEMVASNIVDSRGRGQGFDEPRFRAGIGWKQGLASWGAPADSWLSMSVDVEASAALGLDMLRINATHVGAEAWWGPLALRAGSVIESGGPSSFSISTGAGWRNEMFQVDYALFQREFSAQHRIALTTQWGREIAWERFQAVEAAEIRETMTIVVLSLDAPSEGRPLADVYRRLLTVRLSESTWMRVVESDRPPESMTAPLAVESLAGKLAGRTIPEKIQTTTAMLSGTLRQVDGRWQVEWRWEDRGGIGPKGSVVVDDLRPDRLVEQAGWAAERLAKFCRPRAGSTAFHQKPASLLRVAGLVGFAPPDGKGTAGWQKGLERMSQALVASGRFAVVGKGVTDRVLTGAAVPMEEASDDPAGTGKLLGVDAVVWGRLERLGQHSYWITALVNAQTGTVEEASTVMIGSTDQATEAIRAFADRLTR